MPKKVLFLVKRFKPGVSKHFIGVRRTRIYLGDDLISSWASSKTDMSKNISVTARFENHRFQEKQKVHSGKHTLRFDLKSYAQSIE